jgi:hypothetical protein
MTLYAGKGKLRIASDQQGAYVYVDGKKKAMTGEGFTSILLEEGEYMVKVVKPVDESFEYAQSKKVFVGEDTSTKLTFKLEQQMTAKGKALQAQKDTAKLTRWKRSGEVVTDSKLGLVWQDNSAAKSTKKKWKSAKKYCKNLSLADYSDWRLPSYEELLSIVDYDRYDPAIMPSFKNVNTSDYFWSSSVYVSGTNGAWVVYFKNGYASGYLKIGKGYVRCVRDRSK